jgi:hypothetical protein
LLYVHDCTWNCSCRNIFTDGLLKINDLTIVVASVSSRAPKSRHLTRAWRYSMRSAVIGSILAARLAGMKPAKAANNESTRMAPPSVKGSYVLTP